MSRRFVRYAAILGALSVILGAFGAHGLKKLVSPEAVATFETGVRYQFYHTFAILALGCLYRRMPGKLMEWSARFFLSGIVLFSGSLYALTFLEATDSVGLKGIGAITPLGGLCFIAGWVCLFIQSMKSDEALRRSKRYKDKEQE